MQLIDWSTAAEQTPRPDTHAGCAIESRDFSRLAGRETATAVRRIIIVLRT
jgi:hypothetical protein